MLVVATEALVGWRGIPATQFSRRRTRIRPRLPAFLGREWSTELNTPTIAAVREQASDRLRPQGMQSGLSRRSTSMQASSGSIATRTLSETPSAGVPGKGTWRVQRVADPAGILRIA